MEKLYTPTEAAKLLGVSVNTLNCWRSSGRYALAWVRVGKLIRYRQSDLERFLDSRIVCPSVNARA